MGKNGISWVLAALMALAAFGGYAARPSEKAADRGNSLSLETVVPKAFGDWSELPEQGPQVVNPQTQAILDTIYSQLLSRTYVNKQGYRIMLSLAYGDDQRGALQAHKPEVCYPAQGFQLHSNQLGQLNTAFGNVEVRRLSTSLGQRAEPVTYWFTVGDQVIQSKFDKRLAEIKLGLTGQIPDGLLFRISSIDTDTQRGFAMQQRFAADLLGSVPPDVRKRLSGLGAASTATAAAVPVDRP
jgi:EpsI family protein